MCLVVIYVFYYLVSNILCSSGPENENSSGYFSGPSRCIAMVVLQCHLHFCSYTLLYHQFCVRCLVGKYRFTYFTLLYYFNNGHSK